MKAVRVNLTISGPVDQVIAEYASLTGQSKSAAIAGYLAWQLPHLREWVRQCRASAEPVAASRGDLGALPGLAAAGSGSEGSGGRLVESRADRRRREREERKLGLG